MANKVTIDVEARFIDNVTDQAKAAAESFDSIEKNAKDAQKEANKLNKTKVKPTVDADDSKIIKKLKDSEKKLDKIGRTKAEAKLDAQDRATSKILKVLDKAKSFGGKTYNAILKIRDSDALNTLSKMSTGLKNIAGKTWSTVVKIKDYATAPLRKLRESLFSIKSLVMAITAGLAAKQLVLNPVSLADQYTSAKIGFSTLLGESRGQAMMDEIDSFAAATPFKTSNVISNVQKMMAYGWDAERVIDDMKVIGDAAAATGKGDEGLGSIVYALSEIRSKGKLSTQELNQLASAGIKAKQYLAQGLGYGTDDAGLMKLSKDLEGGAIGANQAVELILEGMKEFDGMMDKTANETITGLKDQLTDLFEINVARRWGQGLQDGLKRGLGSIVGLLDGTGDALSRIGDLAYKAGQMISNWLADKLEVAVDKIKEITDTYEFQNADLGGKASMLWNGLVADPLTDWWEGGGREKTIEVARDIGTSIAKAIIEAIGVAWEAMPTWAKVLVGGYSAGKVAGGIANFAGGVANFIGGAKNAIGGFKASIVPIGPSYVAGSGLLGAVGKAGVGLGATTTGGALLAGAGGIAGGVAMGAGAVKSGVDFYQAYQAHKKGDTFERDANITSGGMTASAMLTGAALGTLIGGPLGTLVGGGLGAIVGWVGGEALANNIRAAKYETEEMKEAIKDSEKTSEELAEIFAKAKWENAREHFGDMKLSMEEITRLANQIVWGDDITHFEQFTSSVKTAESALQNMKSASDQINRWLWKSALGVTFNDDEKEAYQKSFDDYINGAQSYLSNKHYEFTAAVSLLVDAESEGGKGIIASGNAFYGALQEQMNDLGGQLSDKVKIALTDGVIELNEYKEITSLQQQIAEITEKVANAEQKAQLELIQLKFGKGNLDYESFEKFMAQMQTTIDARMTASDEAFIASVSSLKLQLDDGAITQEEYDKQIQALADGYTATVEDLHAQVKSVELDIISEAYQNVLGIDAVNDLNTALQEAINNGLDPIEISDERMAELLNINVNENGETISNIKDMLSGVFNQLGLMEVDVAATITADSVQTEPDFETKILTTIPETLAKDVGVDITTYKGIISPLSLGASDFGIRSTYSFSPTVNINAKYRASSYLGGADGQGFRGGIFGGDSAMDAFARGGETDNSGIVGGSTRFIRVNEESPEMIIPLSSQRRERALKLWTKTGNLLGVPGFARGGSTGNRDEGLRFQSYGGNDAAGGQSVQVDVGGITVEIHVNGTDKEGIVEAIKAQVGDIADYVVGRIADELAGQFENTPVRGGVS